VCHSHWRRHLGREHLSKTLFWLLWGQSGDYERVNGRSSGTFASAVKNLIGKKSEATCGFVLQQIKKQITADNSLGFNILRQHLPYLEYIRRTNPLRWFENGHLTHPQYSRPQVDNFRSDTPESSEMSSWALDDSWGPCSLFSWITLFRRVSRIFFGLLHICILLRNVVKDRSWVSDE